MSTTRPALLPLALTALALVCAREARAVDILFPGIQPKVSAGAGQTVSRGPAALYYNPANLIMTKFVEPDLDVSFAQISYTYQHTDVDNYPDPAIVKLTTPLVTAGLAFRPVEMLSLGVAILPTGSGAPQEVPNVVSELQKGAFENVTVVNKNEGNKIAAGAAVRFGFPFAIGIGMIRHYEKTQIQVFRETDEELATVDALYGGTFYQYVVGARSELIDRALVLAFSYKTAVTKKYTGDIAFNIAGEPGPFQAYEGVGYVPSAIGLGLETRFGSFGVFGEFYREQWSAGRAVYRRGIGEDPPEVDFLDTNNFAGGIKWWPAGKHMLELAGGMYGANVGDGLRAEADDGEELTQDDEDEAAGPRANDVGGVGFGNLEAIKRIVFSGGYRYKLTGNGYLQMGGQYQKGSRIVPEGLDGEGAYTLTVMMGSVGLAFGF